MPVNPSLLLHFICSSHTLQVDVQALQEKTGQMRTHEPPEAMTEFSKLEIAVPRKKTKSTAFTGSKLVRRAPMHGLARPSPCRA